MHPLIREVAYPKNMKHKWPPRKHIVVYIDKIGTNKMQQTKTKFIQQGMIYSNQKILHNKQ